MPNLETDLTGYRLTTAEILYHLPDHPSLLQSYVWQQYDIAPELPRLNKFFDFWTDNIEGRLHTVRVATAGFFQPVEIAYADVQLTLH